MPNGGVPLHMVMNLKEAPGAVLHCKGAEIRLYERGDWEANHAEGTAIASLSQNEALVLARFVAYWLNPSAARAPILYKHADVDVQFDY
jgi:hypothetical protein